MAIKETTSPLAADIERRVNEALVSGALSDAARITVTLRGDCAVLRGCVRSWTERCDAERAAALAPGITRVDNQLSLLVKGKLQGE